MRDSNSVEAGNATHSGRIPSIKKSTAAAIKSLIPKKRTNRSILDSDDEKSVNSGNASVNSKNTSVNSVNTAIQNIFNDYNLPF
jgi:hypothetical protein